MELWQALGKTEKWNMFKVTSTTPSQIVSNLAQKINELQLDIEAEANDSELTVWHKANSSFKVVFKIYGAGSLPFWVGVNRIESEGESTSWNLFTSPFKIIGLNRIGICWISDYSWRFAFFSEKGVNILSNTQIWIANPYGIVEAPLLTYSKNAFGQLVFFDAYKKGDTLYRYLCSPLLPLFFTRGHGSDINFTVYKYQFVKKGETTAFFHSRGEDWYAYEGENIVFATTSYGFNGNL